MASPFRITPPDGRVFKPLVRWTPRLRIHSLHRKYFAPETLRQSVYCLVFALLAGAFLVGCPSRPSEDLAVLRGHGHTNFGDARQQKEDFDRSFELLNNLDDSPSLPNTPGFERLVSVADWLDNWIRTQRPDEHWSSYPEFVEVELASRNASESARHILHLLAVLRGEQPSAPGEGREDTESPASESMPSESLQAERQAIVTELSQLVANTQKLASLANLPSIGRFAEAVFELQRRFAALDTIANLDAARIQAFARTLDLEVSVFASYVDQFEAYARQMQTDGLFMTVSDVGYLKQSTWMRDISRWASGERRVLLEQAVQIGDWVVCNIEMRSNWMPINQQQSIEVLPQYPWQTLLLGYGTVPDRMAVFMELLRQMRIDSALLAVPDPRDSEIPLIWAVGVLLDGEVYVFVLNYGFPIPGPDGVQIGDDGSLQFSSVATLSQLIENDSLLRQLDISESQPFLITSDMLTQTTAHLFLMPESVSMRMKVLEAELSAEQHLVLYTDPHELRRRFLEASGITGVSFWKYPFRTAYEQRFETDPTNEALSIFLVERPLLDLEGPTSRRHHPLWSGRIQYFKGHITGPENALAKYQNTRVSDREMIEYRTSPLFRNNPDWSLRLQWLSLQAAYWLGAALFEIDSIPASKDILWGIRSHSLNSWRYGTEYLLGRIAEREKRYDDARRHYENTSASLSGAGNQVRAQWLPD